jgi:hypothetical protein
VIREPVPTAHQDGTLRLNSRRGAKALATKFLRIFYGIYFGFSAGNPIFATRSKSRLSGTLKSGLRRVVGERMVR